MKEARFCQQREGTVDCRLCPHGCVIRGGQAGLCGARRNYDGVLYAQSYGQISSLAVDPIEKKPLHHFYPGSRILSAGSFGCNMKCGYCQNSSISQETPHTDFIAPEQLAEIAASVPQNLGVAFTYNEPFTAAEYLLDTAPLIQKMGLKVVLVTNGLVCREPLLEILPFVDAMNIDLKCFSARFYQKLGGFLETVQETIATAAETCHVEVTTLVIPGENDTEGEMLALSGWLAGISPQIPLHLSRFFPRYHMKDKEPTPAETLRRLAETAKIRLAHVHIGNL